MPAAADDDVRERLANAGLGRHAEGLEGLARSSVRLRTELDDAAAAGPGSSRLGGHPDLPEGFVWPAYEGEPQSFVAQINLAEISAFDRDGMLPAEGLLSFFYDSEQRVWGFDPKETGAWAVHYFPDIEALAPAPTSAGIDPIFGALGLREPTPAEPFVGVGLRASTERTWPPWESSAIGALGLTRDESFEYAGIFDDEEEDLPVHRLLGHPDPVQGDMQLECQLVSHGRYCGDGSGYTGEEAARLAPGAVGWHLLLQIDSDDDANMMWGDAGRIYYWMHRDALAGRRWHEAHLILQCG
jgi:uncharacterized protein YwqG